MSVKIEGDAEYPAEKTDWVDKTDPDRRLHIEIVEPGDRLGREIRGTIKRQNLERPYSTNLDIFHKVWQEAS